jgi:ABC-type sugar transport system ATPase subunit
MLELKNVSKKVGRDLHIDDVSMTLEKGSVNILLGPTLSGKTSLMRLMAGLDRPTSGEILMNGSDVVGMPVQKRNVAMVYQQFINYPAMTVYENIASPMRVAGVDGATIDRRVREAADLMKLSPYLDRTPLNLSGGQQQRTALARALVKDAELVLLDEPLANLDYKLREELRVELPKIFAETGAIFVYATTEPQEALLLGGRTATLSQGRVTQFDRTIDVYNSPSDLLTAQTFSDPPMNILGSGDGGKPVCLCPVSVRIGCGKTDAAQHHFSGLLQPFQGHIRFDGQDVTHLQPDRAQHRPGVPVSGRLRHHDGAPEPGLSRCATAGPQDEITKRVNDIAEDDRIWKTSRPPGTRPHRRCQAEDLARPRAGARRRQRDPVRRAADRDRPAHEMAAADQAEGAAPPVRPHDDLRDPRPDRGADLRRQGGGDV